MNEEEFLNTLKLMKEAGWTLTPNPQIRLHRPKSNSQNLLDDYSFCPISALHIYRTSQFIRNMIVLSCDFDYLEHSLKSKIIDAADFGYIGSNKELRDKIIAVFA